MQHKPRPAIHMEKQLGWACKLGGAEFLCISKTGATVLARLVESHIWHQLAMYGTSLDGCGFFNSVVVRLPFNLISDSS